MSDPIEAYYTPLQSALRAAGVRGLQADFEETSSAELILSITPVTGVEAFNMATLLRAGLDSSGETLPRTWPADEVMTRHEAKTAYQDLAYALAEADIDGLTLEQGETRSGVPVLHIRHLVGADAVELAELLHAGLADHHATANALREALHARGVDGDKVVPAPGVGRLLVGLGEISLPTALAFGTALGASPYLWRVDELADHETGEQIMDRLNQAVKSAAPGGFMDLSHHPCCDKCSHVSSIALGPVTLSVATRLITVLRGRPS